MIAREGARDMRALGGHAILWGYHGVAASLAGYADEPNGAAVLELMAGLDASRAVGGEAAAVALEAFAAAVTVAEEVAPSADAPEPR